MPFLRIALLVSLGLNLFVIGWWAGEAWRRPQPMQAQQFTVLPIMDARLSTETMDALRPSLVAMGNLMRQGFQDRAAVFENLIEVVKAEPYDKGKVDELLARLVDDRTSVEKQQWQLVAEMLAKLTAEQRAAFAEVIFVRPGPQMPWLPAGPGGPPPRQPLLPAP